jgi:alkyl hydroperoxide reductase subunit AhpF
VELSRRPPGPVAFFDDVDRAYVVAQLEGAMDEPVDLELAVRRGSRLLLPGLPGPNAVAGADAGPAASEEARRAERFAQELGALVPRLRVQVHDTDHDVPLFTLGTRGSRHIRFVGVPRVNLFRAVLETIRRASTHDHGLPPDWARAVGGLTDDVHALVFATPTCPSCPPVVSSAIRMGLASDRLRVDVVDGIAGMDLVREWGVSGVPTVILNGRFSVEGPVPEESLLEFVRHAADPSHPPPAIASVHYPSCGRLEAD